jgi:hypothetical protein
LWRSWRKKVIDNMLLRFPRSCLALCFLSSWAEQLPPVPGYHDALLITVPDRSQDYGLKSLS